MFLCETKNVRSVVNPIITKLGYKNSFMVDPIGAAGGLVVAWKIGINLKVERFSKNLIDCQIREVVNGKEIKLYCVYVPTDWNEKCKFWNFMAQRGSSLNQEWLVIGDLELGG